MQPIVMKNPLVRNRIAVQKLSSRDTPMSASGQNRKSRPTVLQVSFGPAVDLSQIAARSRYGLYMQN